MMEKNGRLLDKCDFTLWTLYIYLKNEYIFLFLLALVALNQPASSFSQFSLEETAAIYP